MNAYLYVRYSTKTQEKGASKDRQIELGRAMCERRGWTIVETIEDLGRSAYAGDHLKSGNLGKFKTRVDAGDIPPGSVLVVENLDRLSRQEAKHARRWMEQVTEAGVLIATATNDRLYDADAFNGNNLVDILEILISAKRANDESGTKSARVKDSWVRARVKASTGEVIGGRIPAWLEVGPDGNFRVIGEGTADDRAAIVRRIYEDCAAGYGKWAIAARLTQDGIEPWGKPVAGRLKRGWEWSYILKLLNDPRIEGEYRPNVMSADGKKVPTGEVIRDYFPRVVDAELVARARSAMKARKGTGGKQRLVVSNLFGGVTECGGCGGPMHFRNIGTHGGPYLQCANARHKRGCEFTKPLYHYPRFEKAALDHILHRALDDNHFTRPDATRALMLALAETEKELETVRAEAGRLVRLLAKPEFEDSPEVMTELAASRARIRELETARDEQAATLAAARGKVTPAEHMARVSNIRVLLDDQDMEVRREARLKVQAALNDIVEKAVCDPHSHTIAVTMVGGLNRTVFDNDGHIIDESDAIAGELAALLASDDVADHATANAYLAGIVGDAFKIANAKRVLSRQSKHKASAAHRQRVAEALQLVADHEAHMREFEVPADRVEAFEEWQRAGRPKIAA